MCVLSCYHVCACMGCLLYVLVSVCKRVKVATVQVDNRKHLVVQQIKLWSSSYLSILTGLLLRLYFKKIMKINLTTSFKWPWLSLKLPSTTNMVMPGFSRPNDKATVNAALSVYLWSTLNILWNKWATAAWLLLNTADPYWVAPWQQGGPVRHRLDLFPLNIAGMHCHYQQSHFSLFFSFRPRPPLHPKMRNALCIGVISFILT